MVIKRQSALALIRKDLASPCLRLMSTRQIFTVGHKIIFTERPTRGLGLRQSRPGQRRLVLMALPGSENVNHQEIRSHVHLFPFGQTAAGEANALRRLIGLRLTLPPPPPPWSDLISHSTSTRLRAIAWHQHKLRPQPGLWFISVAAAIDERRVDSQPSAR